MTILRAPLSRTDGLGRRFFSIHLPIRPMYPGSNSDVSIPMIVQFSRIEVPVMTYVLGQSGNCSSKTVIKTLEIRNCGALMFHLTPSEILFFLWCDRRVTFDLPGGIVSPDPVTYTIEWPGKENFAHSWRIPFLSTS